MEFLAKTVFELLDQLNVKGGVTVVGHGMGCLVALQAAQVYGNRMEGLVLLSPVYPSKEVAEVLEQKMMSAWMGMSSLVCTNNLNLTYGQVEWRQWLAQSRIRWARRLQVCIRRL